MRYLLVMGVSGTGKSSVGQAVAARLDAVFLEGDALHPPENIRRMEAGIPLTDALRQPWLEAICDAALAIAPERGMVVIACSALKRRYRDFIRSRLGEMAIVYLDGDPVIIRERMGHRPGHFMPTSLLDSQLAELEPPSGENVIRVDIANSIETIAAEAIAALGQRLAGRDARG